MPNKNNFWKKAEKWSRNACADCIVEISAWKIIQIYEQKQRRLFIPIPSIHIDFDSMLRSVIRFNNGK